MEPIFKTLWPYMEENIIRQTIRPRKRPLVQKFKLLAYDSHPQADIEMAFVAPIDMVDGTWRPGDRLPRFLFVSQDLVGKYGCGLALKPGAAFTAAAKYFLDERKIYQDAPVKAPRPIDWEKVGFESFDEDLAIIEGFANDNKLSDFTIFPRDISQMPVAAAYLAVLDNIRPRP